MSHLPKAALLSSVVRSAQVAIVAAFLLLSLGTVRAQYAPSPGEDPRIPKAIPYRPGDPRQPQQDPNTRDPRVVQPERVVPAARPAPGTQEAPRVARPAGAVVPGQRQPPPARPAQTGDPEDDLFTYASLAFSSGYYDVAADRLSAYIQGYPRGKHLQAALFRLGECQLKLGDKPRATVAFQELVRKFREGEFVALAAYRLASLSYEKQDLTNALTYFTLAQSASEARRTILAKRLSAETTEEGRTDTQKRSTENHKLWLSAAYYKAYCLQAGNRKKDAIAAYEQVADETRNNPYRAASLRELATLSTATGDEAGAIAALEKLAGTGGVSDKQLQAEAKIKIGILHSDAGAIDKARPILEEAIALNPTGYWGAVGRYTLINILYGSGDYAEATNLYSKISIKDLPDNLRPKLLLTVGNAQRKRRLHVRAIDAYNTVDEYYPNSEEAVEAGYLKLICFYKIKDRDLPDFVDNYVINMTKRAQRQFVDRALLLKAEHDFRDGNFLGAARTYSQIDPTQVPESIRPAMLYNRGWCESEANQDKEAILTLTRFLEEFPAHPLTAKVYATRALSYRKVGNPASALEDLGAIIKNHPNTTAAELAYQQSGLIHGEQQNWRGMIESFDGLISAFPRSEALAEAYFYSGKSHFELKEFEQAIPKLKKAVELDPKSYFHRGQMRLVLSNYFLQRPDALAAEIDHYLADSENANIDPKVLSWLGARYFEDGNSASAAKYLRLGVTPKTPASTLPIVWMYLAKAELDSKNYDGATTAIDFYLDLTKRPSSKARGYLVKAQAHLLGDEFDDADNATREGLQLQKEGRINAELMIMQGDISVARGTYEANREGGDEALAKKYFNDGAAKFVIVSEIFVDPVITPSALEKAADAYENIGEEVKAATLRADLEKRFPEFELPNSPTGQ